MRFQTSETLHPVLLGEFRGCEQLSVEHSEHGDHGEHGEDGEDGEHIEL